MRSRRTAGSNNRHSGFTLIEVVFALAIFLAMVIVFAAVFPIAVTASRFSNNYSQAAELAQHKIDELRGLPWSGFSSANFISNGESNLLSNNVIDAGTCTTIGSGFTCNFTNIDNIANNGSNIGYFPAGSVATVSVTPDTNDGAFSYVVYTATVTISWSGGGVSSGSYSTAAKLVENVSP